MSMDSALKLVRGFVAFARVVAGQPLPSVAGTSLGIGHMLPALVVAIDGGRLKRPGTAAGKIASQQSGKKFQCSTIGSLNATSPT